MARKGEKAKSRKSPDKSPRRVGRPPRRRKKSDSESSEDKKPPELPTEVVPEQGESSESGRMRRSTRRQAAIPEASSTSEPKPQPTEWKEDESFWSKDEVDNAKVEERGREDEGGATMWKVQTSNGSGGEIQKLRICRQRPGGGGSDSAESSMSPAKESSPLHKRSLKRESQKSPLVETENDLPSASSSTEYQDSSIPNQVNESDSPTSETQEKSITPVVQETPELHEPAQPAIEIPSVETESKKVENRDGTITSNVQEPEVAPESKTCEDKSIVESKENKEVSTDSTAKETTSSSLEKTDEKTEDSKDTCDRTEELTKTESSANDIENPTTEKPEGTNHNEKLSSIEKPTEPVEKPSPEPVEKLLTDSVERPSTEPAEKPANQPVEKSITQPDEIPPAQQDEKPSEESTIIINTDINKIELADNAPDQINSRQGVTTASRRKSDSSVKSGGSRRSSISLPASANSESNEPFLEISVNKSPIHEGKEEGEIIEDEKSDGQDQTDKELKHKDNKTDEAARGKIIINRRSTNDSTTSESSKPGSGTPATTAKKHPLITGPEPDESPAIRRRKLNMLTVIKLSTKTVTTPGGATRQVRSIPGEALKAVLLPESEKKEKEKRPRLPIKIKEETVDIGGGDNKPTSESVVSINKVEDVREILKNNRAAEKRNSEREKEVKSTKSPIKTSPVIEVKVPARKVSIGTAPVIEEVKATKPRRSKSPGDTKATPILFITNLVRPFTAGQLKELLARTGTIAPSGFFIDKIKSKCFVKYVDVEMAIETRHALNGVRWPVSNPKVLKVAYAYEDEMKAIQESAEGEVVDDLSASHGSGWLSSEQAVSKDKEKRKTATPMTREWDRGKPKTGSDVDVIFVHEYKKEDKMRQASARVEIDRNERHRDRTDIPIKEDQSKNHSQLERDRDRKKRRFTPADMENSPPPPARKFKKKDYDAPAKLLDNLFRETKTSPCLYWLPLSAEQIAEKEETRRKQMVKHEKKMAEIKKCAQERRDRERDRDRERRRK